MTAPKPKRILILGYPYFVNRLTELGKDSAYILSGLPKNGLRRWLSLFRADLIYLIGGDLRPNRFYRVALLFGKKVIIHWVGTDIVEMKSWLEQGHKFCSWMLKQATHWAEVNWTAAELDQIGVNAQVVPLTPASFPENTKEFPDKFVVLTYLPPGKARFYGEDKIIGLALEFPEIVFLAVAASPTDRSSDWPLNMIPIGWVDNMGELYREVVVLVRLTEHDGLSFMVLEALAHARHVIWSYPFSGVLQATDDAQLASTLNGLYQEFSHGKLLLNIAGRETVEHFYLPQAVWDQIEAGIKGVLAE